MKPESGSAIRLPTSNPTPVIKSGGRWVSDAPRVAKEAQRATATRAARSLFTAKVYRGTSIIEILAKKSMSHLFELNESVTEKKFQVNLTFNLGFRVVGVQRGA